jgi:hypothetical protein
MTLDWETESLRASLFSDQTLAVTDDDWRAVSKQTENYSRQTTAGGQIYTGNSELGQLTLSGINKRVDLLLSFALPTGPAEIGLPTIGRWTVVREKFAKLTVDWLAGLEFPITRIAFGAVLLFPTDSPLSTYTTLQRLLASVSIDPENMKELVFRVNWPVASKSVRNLMINRITNWSAIQLVFASVEVAPSPSATATTQRYAVRLELDHNTDAANTKPFDRAQILSLYEELMSAASENAVKGERP